MRDNGDVRRATQDTPPPPGGLNVNPQSPRTWGLWFGWLTPSGWSFEKAPTPATIIPHLAVFDSGMVAIVSTRLIPPDPPQQTEAQQALYLTYRSPDDQWENSGELLRSSPDPSFTAAVGAPDGVLYVLYGYNGHLFCANAQTGATVWEDATNRGNSAALVDVGPVMLALTVNSELAVFKPSDKEYSELAKFKVADTETWAHPVADGNRVFVRDRESVALWTIE